MMLAMEASFDSDQVTCGQRGIIEIVEETP
jgi:hypothetical protein